MARARNIKPGFFKNEKLADLGAEAMLLFAGLWTLADRAGRLEYRPKRIKAEIFPYWPKIQIDTLLSSLHDAGFIVRYEVDGEQYMHIPNFGKHQHPHVKEVPSTIPAPCEHRADTGPARLVTDSLILIPDSLTPSKGVREFPAPKAVDLNGVVSQRFEEFWSQYPLQENRDVALRAFISVVTTENEERMFACLARYLASDQVARAVVKKPDNWLFEQNNNKWDGHWPKVRDPPKSKSQQRAEEYARERELEREQERLDADRQRFIT